MERRRWRDGNEEDSRKKKPTPLAWIYLIKDAQQKQVRVFLFENHRRHGYGAPGDLKVIELDELIVTDIIFNIHKNHNIGALLSQITMLVELAELMVLSELWG